MNKFEVGDIICGIKGSDYGITDERMTKGVVVEIDIGIDDHEDGDEDVLEDGIRVKVLEHTKNLDSSVCLFRF